MKSVNFFYPITLQDPDPWRPDQFGNGTMIYMIHKLRRSFMHIAKCFPYYLKSTFLQQDSHQTKINEKKQVF
jgi:hypothetical protein